MSHLRTAIILALLFGTLGGLPPRAGASPPVIDGQRDPAYGPALITQTLQTAEDDTLGAAGGSSGWELDEAYGFVSNGVLYLMLTGNMLLQPDPIEPSTFSSPIHVFIDSQAGGQNTLRSDNQNSLLSNLSGLTFDTNFTPDHWLGCAGTGGPDFGTPYSLFTEFAELPSNAGAATTYLGSAQVGGQFPLSGGSNPFGIMVALDNSNTGGVSRGCGASSGVGVTTGFECAIPLAAIGTPVGPIKVCALYEGTEFHTGVSNQVLGPLPPGTCEPVAPSSVNFGTIAGDQFFVVDPATVAVPPLAPLGLWLAPRVNPAEALTVRVTLPNIAAARLEVIDIGGRRVLDHPLENGAAGTEAIELARSGQLPAGVYLVRLTQGANTVTARVVIRR